MQWRNSVSETCHGANGLRHVGVISPILFTVYIMDKLTLKIRLDRRDGLLHVDILTLNEVLELIQIACTIQS